MPFSQATFDDRLWPFLRRLPFLNLQTATAGTHSMSPPFSLLVFCISASLPYVLAGRNCQDMQRCSGGHLLGLPAVASSCTQLADLRLCGFSPPYVGGALLVDGRVVGSWEAIKHLHGSSMCMHITLSALLAHASVYACCILCHGSSMCVYSEACWMALAGRWSLTALRPTLGY